MGYLLRSARGKKRGIAIPIRVRVFLIGSSPKSQIRSRKPGIGRRHCALVSRKKQLYLHDLESGHPTRVNGLTLTPGTRLQLKTGDRVALGPMEFVIEERKKKKPAVPVATPYAAPPVPMGRPASAHRHGPVVVPITSALATVPSGTDPNSPVSNVWSLVLLGALAIVGLGAGVGLSHAIIGRGNHNDRGNEKNRVVQQDTPKEKSPDLTAVENRVERKQEEPKKEEKPVEVKKPPEEKKPPVEEKKPPVEEKKPPVEEKKPPVEEPKKPDPPMEQPKKPVEPPTKPVDPPTKPVDPPTKPVEPATNRIAFATHVLPVLKERCIDCHGGSKKKGGLDLTTIEAMLKGGDSGVAIVAGDPDKSPLFQRVDDGTMPPAGKPITPAQKKLLQDWILGAKTGGFAK